MDVLAISLQSAILAARVQGEEITTAAEELVVRLFQQEGRSLVRLARLFVDDREAAEDLVQEAFLRLARSAHRISDIDRAPAYLRSIVLNLARDHNRRGLVSLRHHSTSIGRRDGSEPVGRRRCSGPAGAVGGPPDGDRGRPVAPRAPT